MVSETKISKGYQTVVPAELRESHGILPGDRLVWVEEKGEIKVKVRKKKTIKDIIGIVPGKVKTDAVEMKKRAQRGEL
jgi:bifunctional DNA-binding transcriptional regulator/antitoxin component of YhaV-PrlF toxin-antitoxin module